MRNTIIVAAFICFIDISMSVAQWTWEPYVIEIMYSKNDDSLETVTIIGKSGEPSIVINTGDKIEFREITCSLFPTRTMLGVKIIKQENIDEIAEKSTEPINIRARFTARKYFGHKNVDNWYDESDELITEWAALGTNKLRWSGPQGHWLIGDGWDYIRIQTLVQKADLKGFDIVNEMLIALTPTDPESRLRSRIGHNIFSYINAYLTSKGINLDSFILIVLIVFFLIIFRVRKNFNK